MLYTSEICCCNLNLWPMYANLTSKQNHLDWMVSTKVCRWRRRWELMWSLVGRKVWSSSSKRKVGTTTNSHLFSSLWRTAQCLHSWWKWSNCRPRNFSWWPLCYCISRHWIVDHCICISTKLFVLITSRSFQHLECLSGRIQQRMECWG